MVEILAICTIGPLPIRVHLRPKYKYLIYQFFLEPTTGIEPVNLFLTKEVLYQLSYVGPAMLSLFVLLNSILQIALFCWSGKRDSNPRPSAWKADALAN